MQEKKQSSPTSLALCGIGVVIATAIAVSSNNGVIGWFDVFAGVSGTVMFLSGLIIAAARH